MSLNTGFNCRTYGAGAWFAPALGALLLVACASHGPAPVLEHAPQGVRSGAAPVAQAVPPPGTPIPEMPDYVVKKGDTLYLIALDHGHDYKDIAAWNNLDNPDRIRVGQVLRMGPSNAVEAGVAAGTQVSPVAPHQGVEARPLGAPGSAAGASTTAASAGSAKSYPKTGKEAYSDQATTAAATGAGAAAATVATRRPDAPPAKADGKPAGAEDEDKLDWGWPAQGKMLATFSEATNKGVDISGKLGDPVIASASGKVVYSGTGLRGYGKLIIIKHNANYLSAYAHNNQILVKEGQLVTKGQKIAEVGNSDADQPMLHFEIRRQGKPVDPLKYLPTQG